MAVEDLGGRRDAPGVHQAQAAECSAPDAISVTARNNPAVAIKMS
jgi:hypothetical protein